LTEVLHVFLQNDFHSKPLLCGEEWEERYLSGTFDGQRQRALMFGTISRDSTGHNLAALRNKTLEQLGVFEINGRRCFV